MIRVDMGAGFKKNAQYSLRLTSNTPPLSSNTGSGRLVAPPSQVNIGRIQLNNDYNGGVQIVLFHPQNPTRVFSTWSFAPRTRQFLAMSNQQINIGGDWGIAIIFGNGVRSRTWAVAQVGAYQNGVWNVDATRIFNNK